MIKTSGVSVIDVVGILSESSISSRYWKDLKRRVSKESGNNDIYAKCVKLKLAAEEETGVNVVSGDNFLKQIEEAKQKPLDKGDTKE